jgi:hypothetical protein
MVPSTAIPAAPAQAIPLSTARLVLEEARLASAEDGGRLWGRELCGPMLLVDPQSRFAVANQSDGHGGLAPADGVFVRTLPTGVVVANTATEWNGQRWTMVMWPSIGEKRRRPAPAAAARVLASRVQADLGLAPSEG